MLTFSNFSTSSIALDSIKESEVFVEIIPYIKNLCYLEFNSREVLEKTSKNKMEELKFEETIKSFKKFFIKIETLSRRSLF